MDNRPVVSRAHALAALASTAALAACGPRGPAPIAIGSKDFTEELLLGEMYAQILEKHGLPVTRKLNLGGTQVAMAALQRGDIDIYPEYTGTALINVLKIIPSSDASDAYDAPHIFIKVQQAYRQRFNLEWLKPAPMNDSQALATTRAISQRYGIRTLSDLSKAAPQLRLGAVPEFTKREDALPGLQRAYGGFRFKDIKLFDIGLKYKALETGQVDVVVAFGTDGQIQADNLVVFIDDKHFWPAYQVAPVVRRATLDRYPLIEKYLDALAPHLTDNVMRALNFNVDGAKQEPADVARQFLTVRGLV
jgi:osmoprotectant transport system substrate-binding protein